MIESLSLLHLPVSCLEEIAPILWKSAREGHFNSTWRRLPIYCLVSLGVI